MTSKKIKQTFELKSGNQYEKYRLDLFLTLNLPDLSRSQIKKQITSENVKVNGQVEFHPQYRVQVGDKIEIQFEIIEHGRKILPNQEIELDIIFENSDYLAINKQAGLVVHPGANHYDDTLANGIKSYLKEKGEDNFDVARAGLVHRLDKATSGVIVIAKNPESLWKISKKFAEREVGKRYLAVVSGLIKTEFEVNTPIGRDPQNRQKFSSKANKTRSAQTRFVPVAAVQKVADNKQIKEYTLVEAFPVTGRTHQIRVHLSESGFPIVGDKKYGGRRAERLLLHAYELSFTWKDKEQSIRAPLGKDFQSVMMDLDFKSSQISGYAGEI